jgi:hypothetical protein
VVKKQINPARYRIGMAVAYVEIIMTIATSTA